MTPSFLESLFDYDDWANAECLASVRRLADPPERALTLLAHVAATKRNHLARAMGEPMPCPRFPEWGLEESASVLQEASSQWREFLSGVDEETLADDVEFDSPAMGGRFRIARQAMIQTALLHAAYHRGQIATLVREAGGQPAGTDLIIAPGIGARRIPD
jgi:uncharacterized damage-inducible protein DinB